MDTQDILKKVRKIEIKTRGLSQNIFAGQYHSAFKGRGMAFAEVREYQYGDDVRDIDWNVTARFHRPFVKVFEEERELTVMWMVDVSGSLDFGTMRQMKRDLATEIAATLAFSAIQNNDKILVERVQSAIYNAIPLWKNQIVIALGLTRQQNVLKMQQAISDTTNELLKRNAEMLKINSIETAKENNRSIVDIETVKKVNDDLVTTIEETLKIQQEGRQARQSAEQELLQIENRLKETLLANMNR